MTASMRGHAIVAIYDAHTAAETAVLRLQQSGLDMRRLSIIGKDPHAGEHALGFYTSANRVKFWCGHQAIWGSLVGILFGSALFVIPAVGPLVVLGPFVARIVSELEGAPPEGAAGAVAAALTGIGIPDDVVAHYDLAVKAGKFLVLARGNAELAERARSVLRTTSASLLTEHGSTSEPSATEVAHLRIVARDAILSLLADDQVGPANLAQAATKLFDGDEYIDLDRADRGVQRADETTMEMERVLPRYAVKKETWSRIVQRLASTGDAPKHGDE